MSPAEAPLLAVRGLRKAFPAAPAPPVRAVDGVDLEIGRGEVVGLVGESGCGKSTLARLIVRLVEPDAGTIVLDGDDLGRMRPRELRARRRDFQMVFQDATGALNPRMTVGQLVAEPLVVHGIGAGAADRAERVARLLEEVGLGADAAARYPREFSGGQRQRIGIARSVACGPRLLVADEPFSALDPPVQAQIVNLLLDLRDRHGLAILLIAHDLRLVEHVCDRVAVMYLGRIVEEGPSAALYADPVHPYTRALLSSSPSGVPGAARVPALAGEPPSASHVPGGCRFRPRCPIARDTCRVDDPALVETTAGRRVACPVATAAGRSSDPAVRGGKTPG